MQDNLNITMTNLVPPHGSKHLKTLTIEGKELEAEKLKAVHYQKCIVHQESLVMSLCLGLVASLH